jgi:hypothetical protein
VRLVHLFGAALAIVVQFGATTLSASPISSRRGVPASSATRKALAGTPFTLDFLLAIVHRDDEGAVHQRSARAFTISCALLRCRIRLALASNRLSLTDGFLGFPGKHRIQVFRARPSRELAAYPPTPSMPDAGDDGTRAISSSRNFSVSFSSKNFLLLWLFLIISRSI